MAPQTQTNIGQANGERLSHPRPGEEVVISGISGSYPTCENIHELRDKLLNKIDLIVERKDGNNKIDGLPDREGKLNKPDKFDAAFFEFSDLQVNNMEPGLRILLEKTYEAIVDGGVNPLDLRGKKVGVYTSSCTSETERALLHGNTGNSYAVDGLPRYTFPNVISNWLCVNGPSLLLDTACSSAGYAINMAYEDIRNGICDAAIVGAANLTLLPIYTLCFMNLGIVSVEAVCKVFDDEAKGYVRSEAGCIVFLQKKKEAKRVYTTIVHSKTNCDGYKPRGITFPSSEGQCQLLKSFYDECGVNPAAVDFVEAHGTGTEVGDVEELMAIERVFTTGRTSPLPIGSLKSNLGHSEGVAALCAISKIILSMELGKLLPNLHFKTPHRKVDALNNGKLKVVTDVEPWNGKLAAVSAFGFGGGNFHILLESNPKQKRNGGKAVDGIPRLVIASGRTRESVKSLLDEAQSHPEDDEFAHLLHCVHYKNIPHHIYRGYTVLSSEDTQTTVAIWSQQRPPLWFVFSGLGTQWPGMGSALLFIPAFNEAIRKCDTVLKPLGVDVYKIITHQDPKLFDNPINCFLGIAAIQIGLVDILTAVGIVPDGIIGHSIGELLCAYADGSLTLEQTVLTAYYRALACVEANVPKGAFVVIEKSSEDDIVVCPKQLELVGLNKPNTCLIAGPAEAVLQFAQKQKTTGKTVRILNSGGVACHSKLLAPAKSKLLQYLQQIIPQSKPRSEKWISSSVPSENQQPLSAAEYHTFSFLGPVLLANAWQKIPYQAVTLEISPNTILSNTKISLYNEEQGIHSLLSGLGKLYESGIDMDLTKLYPPVEYPLSRGTPMISPHIKWEHSQKWFLLNEKNYSMKINDNKSERKVVINIKDQNLAFYTGHNIDQRILFPATGYLLIVWETLAHMNDAPLNVFSVHFKQVKFNRATHIPKSGRLEFFVAISATTGHFEVMEGGTSIVSGFITPGASPPMCNFNPESMAIEEDKDCVDMTSSDIYKELRLRGYNYSGLFRSILRLNPSYTVGEILWVGNWVTYLDNMLQMKILTHDSRNLYVPTFLEELSINVQEHHLHLNKEEFETVLPVYMNNMLGVLKSGGIEIRGIKASPIGRRKALGEPILERHLFVPYNNRYKSFYSLQQVVTMCVHTWLENTIGMKLAVTELLDTDSEPIAPLVLNTIGNLPLVQAEVTVFSESDITDLDPAIKIEHRKFSPANQKNSIAIANNVVNNIDLLQSLLSSLADGGCIIAREARDVVLPQDKTDLDVIMDHVVGNQRILMLKPHRENGSLGVTSVIHVTQKNYDWLPQVQAALKNTKPPEHVLIVAQGEPFSGILGFFNCLQKEPGGNAFRCVFIADEGVPLFDAALPFYREQLSKHLAVNVFKNGEWGSYRHLLLDKSPTVNLPHTYCNTAVLGDLSSLTWFQGPDSSSPEDKRKLVHIYYSALNFRDIMLATGRLPADVIFKDRTKQDCILGFEFSGRTSNGERVMGMVPQGAIANVVKADPRILWRVPDHWSLEDAATVPTVYGTVLFAFIMVGRIKKGESVLIHAGSGGVGQAAIHVALHYGLRVFTTVGTQEKKEFIRKEFPQIPLQNIGNSRDTSFEQMVMKETRGRGVDVILNSLSEEKLQASVRCLADGGRFLEIGKFDLANNNQLSLELFAKNISYHGVVLDLIFNASDEEKAVIYWLLDQALGSGVIKPLKSRTVFSEDEVEQAFRFMASGKHVGKVLIKLKDEEKTKLTVPSLKVMKAHPRFYCDQKLSYIISGGLGGFGLELADWLVLRGARNLVLVSRRGVTKGYQSYRIRILRSYGVKVFISKQDTSTYDGVKELLKEAEQLAPVGGIFNLAAVLQDAILENQTIEKFTESAKGKAVATGHFDVLTRQMCPQLQQFVIFSSVSCGRGNPGQTNYGMSNSVMERICEARVRDGLPGLAVQWGAIGEVGLVADMQEDNKELVIGGTLQQRVSSCLSVLDDFLLQPHPVVASMVVAEKRALNSSENLSERILGVLGLHDIKKFRQNSSLADLGMDSMTGAEIKQVLEQEFEIFLTPAEIRDLTVEQLTQMSNSKQPARNEETKEEFGLDKVLHINLYVKTMLSVEKPEYLPVVMLPSLSTPSKQTAFLIPGLEGLVESLVPLAAQLNCQAACLQLFSQDCGTSVRSMTDFLIPHVMSRADPDTPVQLIGFSFGGLIALELTAALESEGRHCKLVLIDSGPDLLVSGTQLLFKNGEEAYQYIYIMYFLQTVGNIGAKDIQSMLDELKGFFTWEEKLEWLANKLSVHLGVSTSHLIKVIGGIMVRVKAMGQYKYEYNCRIISPVLLLRPTARLMNTVTDYGLSKCCENVQEVRFIEGDHTKIIENPDTATYINEFLGRKTPFQAPL